MSCVEAPDELASSLSSKWNEEESSAEDQPEAAAAVIVRGPSCNGSHAESTSIGVVLMIVKLKVSWPLDTMVYGVKGMDAAQFIAPSMCFFICRDGKRLRPSLRQDPPTAQAQRLEGFHIMGWRCLTSTHCILPVIQPPPSSIASASFRLWYHCSFASVCTMNSGRQGPHSSCRLRSLGCGKAEHDKYSTRYRMDRIRPLSLHPHSSLGQLECVMATPITFIILAISDICP